MLKRLADFLLPKLALASSEPDSLREAFLEQIHPTIYVVHLLTVLVGVLISVPLHYLMPIAAQSVVVAAGFAIWKRRHWSVRAGAWWYLANFWLYVVYLVVVTGGVRGPFFPANTVIVLSAGVLLDARNLLAFALVLLLTGFALLLAEVWGALPPSVVVNDPVVPWIVALVLLLLIGIRLTQYTQIVREALARLRSEVAVRRQAEVELAASESRFRRLFETMPDSYSVGTPGGKILLANQATVELLGYTPEELATVDLDTIYADPADRAAIIEELRSTGSVRDRAVRMRRKDGKEITIESNLQLVTAPDGTQLIEGTQRDITPRLRAEEEIRINAERLATLNEISRAISTVRSLDDVLNLIHDQVRRLIPQDSFYVALYDPITDRVSYPIVFDNGVRYREAPHPLPPNSHMSRVLFAGEALMFNRTPAEIAADREPRHGDINRPSASFMSVPLVGTQRIIGMMSVQSYSPNIYSTEQLELLKGVAFQTEIAVESARLFEALGAELAERKRGEVERERLIAELEDRNAELERFTYTVSHDLKAPLITVRGFLGYLEEDALSGNMERLHQDIGRIGDATDRMRRMLDELLELSRIGRKANPPEDVPFAEIVREARALVSGRLESRRIAVSVAPNLPLVRGDRVRLVEAMQNLLDNAAKFMGAQPAPRIDIGFRSAAGGETVITVRDNGIGIADEYRQRIFGLFEKLDPHSEGSGIGLALVKRIVEVHGGRIWVESQGTGTGATFCITLRTAGGSPAAEQA